jgi:hypothetical protein
MRLIGGMILFGLLTACHIGSPVGPDTPVEPGDDAQHGLGMFVRWSAAPGLPGVLTDKIAVSDVTFQIDHFQILGDAGSATHSNYSLVWDMATVPQLDSFPDAPSGLYSKITLAMMGGNFGDDAFRIEGTWRDGGSARRFVIHDRIPFSFSLDCNAILPAAGSATIAISADLQDALGGVDFKNLDEDNGVLDLHDGPEMTSFRDRLSQAFSLGN